MAEVVHWGRGEGYNLGVIGDEGAEKLEGRGMGIGPPDQREKALTFQEVG